MSTLASSLLKSLFRPGIYWSVLLFGSLMAEGIALYFQYGLDYGPCVLCIHIRLWLAALILVAIAGLLGQRCNHVQRISHLLTAIIAVGFTERSWRTLAIERNWVESSCTFDSGLPEWFSPDQWWPWMFEIWESCGYTPEVVAGFTMAELLATAGILFTLLALIGLKRNLCRSASH